MKYSIIVPTFNSEKWIQQCINSVLAQTYTGFDIVILDSGSTDATLEWLYSLTDSRIRIYTTGYRLSITENWRRILSVPRNEFMTILGHDDVLYPCYLATMDAFISQYPSANLYQSHFDFIDKEGNTIRRCMPMSKQLSGEKFLRNILQNTIEVTASGYMMRTADYNRIGGMPEFPDLLYADFVLWHKLIKNGELAILPKVTFGFRTHAGNTSKTFSANRLMAFQCFVQYLHELQNTDTGYASLIKEFSRAFLEHFVAGSCHKLLYILPANRGGITMDAIIHTGKKAAAILLAAKSFTPEKHLSVRLAKLVDSNAIFRSLFLLVKSMRKRVY